MKKFKTGSKFLFIACALGLFGQSNAMNYRRLAGTCNNNKIKVYNFFINDSENKKIVNNTKKHEPDVKINKLSKICIAKLQHPSNSQLAFSPLNINIVAHNCLNDIKCVNGIIVYDIAKQKEIAFLKGHTGNVNSIKFSTINENILFSGSDDKTVMIWDLSKPEASRCINILTGHKSPVLNIAISPINSRFCASVSSDGQLIIWDLFNQKGQELFKTFSMKIKNSSEIELLSSVNSLKFSNFNTHILSFIAHEENYSFIKILNLSKKDNSELIKNLESCEYPEKALSNFIELKSLGNIKLVEFSPFNQNIIAAYSIDINSNERILIYNLENKNRKKSWKRVESYGIGVYEVIKFTKNKSKGEKIESERIDTLFPEKVILFRTGRGIGSGFQIEELQNKCSLLLFDHSNENKILTMYDDGKEICEFDIKSSKHVQNFETKKSFYQNSVNIMQGYGDKPSFKNTLISTLKNKKAYDLLVKCENN